MKRKLCMALSALMMVSGMAGFGIVAGASDGGCYTPLWYLG